MYYLFLIPIIYFVYTKYKIKFKLMYLSIHVMLEILYISLTQKLNKSIKKINKNQYEITYCIRGRIYKIRSNIQRGPSQILQIIDENSNDVTAEIEPYMGPNYDCHKSTYTPLDFNKQELIFNLSSGQTKVFNASDNIRI